MAASVATMTAPVSSDPFTGTGPANPEPLAQPNGEVGGMVAGGAPAKRLDSDDGWGRATAGTNAEPRTGRRTCPGRGPGCYRPFWTRPTRKTRRRQTGPRPSPLRPTGQQGSWRWPGCRRRRTTANRTAHPPTTNRSGQSYAARSVRRAVRVLVALMAALVLLAVLTVVGVTLGTGSSLRGGVGDNSYSPANLSAVQSYYRLGAGNLDLNLAAVKFPPAGKTVDVTVGLGNLTVEVPKDTVVSVDAKTGIGQVDVFGQRASNVQTTYYGTGTASGAPRLNLDAHVGMGDLQVTQG